MDSKSLDTRREPASLTSLCRDTIVKNLERYNAEAFQILDESEWEYIIRRKHEVSRPKRGKGGIDGTGRMNPVVSDKFLLEIETSLPHLGTSNVVDTLVWKDIVNFKFKSRPTGLLYPCPVLESQLKASAETLLDCRKKGFMDEEDKRLVVQAIKVMSDSPMDIELLRSSGVGKTVQKFINACAKNEKLGLDKDSKLALESLLESWKMMASREGVAKNRNSEAEESESRPPLFGPSEHMATVRMCRTWRELHSALKLYDQERRENQGARMRERRQRLNLQRPKIVKVRHRTSNAKTLNMASVASQNPKMKQLRAEAKVTSTRRSPPVQKSGKGFGAAVAFATASHKRKNATFVDIVGGKRLKIPTSKPPARDHKRNMR